MNKGLRRLFSSIALGLMVCLLLVGDCRAGEGGVLGAIEDEITSIFESNRQGVVRIHALYSHESGDGQPGPMFTHGTGFIFDARGYIMTIDAAVQGAEAIRVMLATDRQVPAHLVGVDPISGVAVIRVEAENLPTVKIGDSERIRIGHYAFILGNDFGNLEPVFGSVHEIYLDGDLIQVTARVQSSYGGAPMFCSNGKVGGIVWRYEEPASSGPLDNPLMPSFLGRGDVPSSVFVIPINRAMRVAQSLVANGTMAYGWLGVKVEVRGKDMVVQKVTPNSPAKLGGLKPGDVMLAFGDRAIAGPHHLKRLVMESPPGTQVTLGIRRAGQLRACQVTLGTLQEQDMDALPDSATAPKGQAVSRQFDLQEEVGRIWKFLSQK